MVSLSGRVALAALAAAMVSGQAMALDVKSSPGHSLRRFMAISLSPDGERVATVEGDTAPSGSYPTTRSLVIRTVNDGAGIAVPLPCGQSESCAPGPPAWSPDGRRLAFALREPASHARSLYEVAADGTGLTKILAFDGTITALRYGKDGRLTMLATPGAVKEVGATEAGAPITGDLAGPPPEQRIAVLDHGALTYASPANLYVYEYDAAPDGGFVGTAAPGDGDAQWWVAKLYRFSPGEARVIYSPADAQHQIADPRVSPDGKTVVFISGLMSDFGSTGGDVFTTAIDGGAATNLTPGMPASARAVGWGCDGKPMAQLLAGDQTQLATIAQGGSIKVLWSGAKTIGGENGGLAQLCPSGATAITMETFTEAPEINVGPLGAWRAVTSMNSGLSTPADIHSLTWTSDGAQVQGWLLVPKGATGKLPLITEVHGGPAAASEPSFAGIGLTRAMLDKGYALFFPNPRGSFGQGEAFARANVKALGHGDLRDILAGIDAAERAAPIDEGRLGITGGSYGGFMTMWAVTQTERFKAGVAAAGISDWLSYYGENGIDQWLIPYFGASVYDDRPVYARSSPIDYIHHVKTPVFAYVGADDIECPPAQTQEFHHALEELGVPTEMAIYPGEGHGLRDPAHVADSEARTLAWFDRYLKAS